MTDAQKRIVFCNDRYLEIYGLSARRYSERHDRAANCWSCGARGACSTLTVEEF